MHRGPKSGRITRGRPGTILGPEGPNQRESTVAVRRTSIPFVGEIVRVVSDVGYAVVDGFLDVAGSAGRAYWKEQAKASPRPSQWWMSEGPGHARWRQ